MAIKKSQIYSTLWESCNALRGSMDASQYKNYVLVMLFVKYLSDKRNEDSLFEIPEGCTFEDIIKLKGVDDGEQMNIILEKIENANPSLKGVLYNTDVDFCNGDRLGDSKKRKETIRKLIAAFEDENLDFSRNRAADDDLIGDAYEYLMRNFASESGKSKGQFYTPAEVSRILAKVIGIDKDSRDNISIYDPTCGSGSLLLRAKAEAKNGTNVSIDGQEMDNITLGMAKMSMIIHGEEFAELVQGDTLQDPKHVDPKGINTLMTYDYVVANPPFSQKGWQGSSTSENDSWGRWGCDRAPIPPDSCGDYAFLLHIIASLKSTGKGACILPHGVLFRGNEEGKIRKYLVEKHYISGIIGLPSNLFYGTGIPACVVVIDKANAHKSDGIFMINASDGFIKDGSKNRLREQDIKLIVDTWNSKTNVEHYSRFVKFEEIEKNDFNLNIPRYVASIDKEIHQDIEAHLKGGYPQFDVDEQMKHIWEACSSLKDKIFKLEENNYYSITAEFDDLNSILANDESFAKQKNAYEKLITDWIKDVKDNVMMKYGQNSNPKEFIEKISSSLLKSAKKDVKLIEPYNVYQILMNQWAEFMQDDCYMVRNDGWTVNRPTPPMVTKKNKDTKESTLEEKKTYDYSEMECDLLPIMLVINEYFPKEQQKIAEKTADLEQYESEQSQIEEDNKTEIDDWKDSKKLSISDVYQMAYIREPQKDEITILEKWLDLYAATKNKDLPQADKKPALEKQNALATANKGVFEPLQNEKGNISKTAVESRTKTLRNYFSISTETKDWLDRWHELSIGISDAKEILKPLKEKMKDDMLKKYDELSTSPDSVKKLVVEKKWIATFQERSSDEMKRVQQGIVNDVKTLAERYSETLPLLEKAVADMDTKVKAHLKEMGFEL